MVPDGRYQLGRSGQPHLAFAPSEWQPRMPIQKKVRVCTSLRHVAICCKPPPFSLRLLLRNAHAPNWSRVNDWRSMVIRTSGKEQQTRAQHTTNARSDLEEQSEC
jgi:hypothetical protein